MRNTVTPKIESDWKSVLMTEFDAPYFSLLKKTLIREYNEKVVYPPKSKLFNAFNHTPFNKVNAVILGQDPYHGLGQAHGLCFSVPEGIPQPPSLRNIFKEINNDLGIPIAKGGNLTHWANQGVFLLNTFLSVVEGAPLSHSKLGWERFTDASIKAISDHKEGVVFLLWGNNARKKKSLIDLKKHHVLESSHPSPLSVHRGFFGCNHFSKTNQLLQSMGKTPIDWQIK